ncbi:MAG TPA: response regulator [Chthoniobacterales bacterium]
MRVLIADDERVLGQALGGMVERCGHEVAAIVSSGLEAIQAYSRLTPDIVLMDYKMPRLNGATACRMILSKDANARVILISGVASSELLSGTGAVGILQKPVEMDRLYSALYDAGSRDATERDKTLPD